MGQRIPADLLQTGVITIGRMAADIAIALRGRRRALYVCRKVRCIARTVQRRGPRVRRRYGLAIPATRGILIEMVMEWVASDQRQGSDTV